MSESNAQHPDLDWSQVRETIKLLMISVIQIERSMREGETSVSTLTGSFTDMVEQLQAIAVQLDTLEESDAKYIAQKHCSATTAKIENSIVAFQFYDRLNQCLEHVVLSLKGLSEIVENPERLYNPSEWKKLQEHIRSKYSMETEKLMFDAIIAGESLESVLTIAAENDLQDTDENGIELF